MEFSLYTIKSVRTYRETYMYLKQTSSISPELKHQVLFRGTFFAFLGVILLIGGGVFLSPTLLGYWGFPLFGVSFGLMALGMIPFRRLSALEKKPNLICLTEDENVQFYSKGKHILTLPISTIEMISFRKGVNGYGIEVKLKKTDTAKVIVYGGPSTLTPFKMRKGTSALFFPYFSERAFNRIKEELFSVTGYVD